MCGRFEFNLGDPYMEFIFNDLQKRYNYDGLHPGEIFPSEKVPALVMKNGNVTTELLTWGYDKFNEKGVMPAAKR